MAFQRRRQAAIGVKAPYPGFIEPALAASVDKVPSGERWLHEIKFDGYRVQLHIANDDIKVFTRRGNDWTKRFKKIASDAYLVNAGSAIIDGEVVVPAADGTTDFSVLQNQLKGKSDKIVMVAFDLLYLHGYDLRKLPLMERKKLIATTAVSRSTAGRCTNTLAPSVSKASSPRFATAAIVPAAATTGPRRPARDVRRCRSRGSRSTARNGTAFIWAGARARTWSMPARLIAGLTRHQLKIFRPD